MFFKLCLCFIFILVNTPVFSCNVKDITKAHSYFLKSQNLPESSLLSIVQNDLSIITNKEVKSNNSSIGNNKFKVFQNISNRRVLKKIIESNYKITNVNLLEISKLSYVQETIVSKDGVFIFVDKLPPFDVPSCYTEIFFPNGNSKRYFNIFSKDNKDNKDNKDKGLSKNLIISRLFDPGYTFNKLQDIITVSLNEYENHIHLDNKIQNLQQDNKYVRNLTIYPKRAGLQISEITMPISAYNRARKFKDSNELFYSSSFKSSKNPNLIKAKPIYEINIGSMKKNRYLNIDSKFKITEKLDSNIGLKYSNNKLNISSFKFRFKKFLQKDELYSSSLGRLSKLNTGLLFNFYKLNPLNDSLVNATAYLGVKPNCGNCIKNGAAIGFEQYYPTLDSSTKMTLILQNFKNQTETTLEVSLRKQLSNQNQITVATRYNITNHSPSLSAKFIFPLNPKNNKKRYLGSIFYKSNEKELISNWSQDLNAALMENTPGFLRRNWNNYINF